MRLLGEGKRVTDGLACCWGLSVLSSGADARIKAKAWKMETVCTRARPGRAGGAEAFAGHAKYIQNGASGGEQTEWAVDGGWKARRL